MPQTPVPGAQSPGNMATGGTGTPAMPAPGDMTPMPGSEALEGECPAGFEPKEGDNVNFADPSGMRQFVVKVPSANEAPAPLFVSLTGTVESTNANLGARGNTQALTEKGWVVLGPVRRCSTSPDDSGSACNGVGMDGWQWAPWNEGAQQGSGMKWYQEVGPDALFLKAMVKCVATKWKIDAKRLFVGGISSGGTFANRLVTFQSDFWAGGMPISGEMYLDNPNAVQMNPMAVQDGRCCPYPLDKSPEALGPMIVISMWGGDTDTWPGANYRPSTQVFSNYMATQKNVVHLACSGDYGHMWPVPERDAYNAWFADIFAAFPKGSDPTGYTIPKPPPMSYSCKIGAYDDHY